MIVRLDDHDLLVDECYWSADDAVLDEIKANSQNSALPPDLSMASTLIGHQVWEEGRLIEFCSAGQSSSEFLENEACVSEYVLSGSIPSSISNLDRLQSLILPMNMLSGTLPNSISDLSELKHLYLTSNYITGNIPVDIGNLQKLEHLSLGINKMNGELPSSLWSLFNLKLLDLQAINTEFQG